MLPMSPDEGVTYVCGPYPMRANKLLVPTPGTAHHVSCYFRGGRGTTARWA